MPAKTTRGDRNKRYRILHENTTYRESFTPSLAPTYNHPQTQPQPQQPRPHILSYPQFTTPLAHPPRIPSPLSTSSTIRKCDFADRPNSEYSLASRGHLPAPQLDLDDWYRGKSDFPQVEVEHPERKEEVVIKVANSGRKQMNEQKKMNDITEVLAKLSRVMEETNGGKDEGRRSKSGGTEGYGGPRESTESRGRRFDYGNRENAAVEEENRKLKKENESLLRALDETAQDLKVKIRASNQESQNRITQLEDSLSAKNTALAEAQKFLIEIQSTQSSSRETELELKALRLELANESKKRKDAETERGGALKQQSMLAKGAHEMEVKLEGLKRELEGERERRGKAEVRANAAESLARSAPNAAGLQSECQRLRHLVTELQEERKKHGTVRSDSNAENRMLQDKIKMIRSDCDGLRKRIEELLPEKQMAEKLKRDKEFLKDNLQKMTVEKVKLEKQNNRLREQVNEVKEQAAEARTKLVLESDPRRPRERNSQETRDRDRLQAERAQRNMSVMEPSRAPSPTYTLRRETRSSEEHRNDHEAESDGELHSNPSQSAETRRSSIRLGIPQTLPAGANNPDLAGLDLSPQTHIAAKPHPARNDPYIGLSEVFRTPAPSMASTSAGEPHKSSPPPKSTHSAFESLWGSVSASV